MPAFHFYSASTSAIEIPEKKNDIIISPSRSLHCAQSLNRCVGCVVCMHVNRKGADKVLRAISFFLFKPSCVDIGKTSCNYQTAEKHESCSQHSVNDSLQVPGRD